ncbi:CapA family protein [Paenibacillus thiaminolyticus]|uniref:CapA family protein n=1 Tax=Paenibacillus thiaminolyticus TaxID=49283 RepID=A0A3A3GIA2_PANTH|nr:CapA family protein [Paenibacillus thiaminolyticus]RJG23964.1 CapA family protein [Paenibacillus thiaminolyticus]
MSTFQESRRERHQRLKQRRRRKWTAALAMGAAALLFSAGILLHAMDGPRQDQGEQAAAAPYGAPPTLGKARGNGAMGPLPPVYGPTAGANAAADGPIRLVFAGDALMDWSVKETIRKQGPDYPFAHVAEEIQEADFAVVNLETAVTFHNQKDTNQLFNFKSDPISLEGLKNAGFDLVSIANNHTLDFKQKGFLDTLANLEHYELPFMGGGKNGEEAYRAHEVTIKGKRIKFLAFSRFIPQTYWFAADDRPGIAEAYNKSSVLPVIRKESQDCDYLFVYMHWGVEKNNKPEPWQRTYAREMIDAGADGIVGSHVHVLQGFEWYNGKPIAYSIGNFLFPNYVKGKNADTGLLTLTIEDDGIRMSFSPYQIYRDQIIKKDAAYVKRQFKYLESISYDVAIGADRAIEAIQSKPPASGKH